MADAELPPADLRAFLYSCIDSIEQAEIVVHLHGLPDAATARTVARALGTSDANARHHLEILVARGILQTTVGDEVTYRYRPRSAELLRYTEQLLEWWSHSRPALIRFISSRRRDSLKRFGDAFKLKGSE
jgi:hypothetical protein